MQHFKNKPDNIIDILLQPLWLKSIVNHPNETVEGSTCLISKTSLI